jgi:hypothetical protein
MTMGRDVCPSYDGANKARKVNVPGRVNGGALVGLNEGPRHHGGTTLAVPRTGDIVPPDEPVWGGLLASDLLEYDDYENPTRRSRSAVTGDE